MLTLLDLLNNRQIGKVLFHGDGWNESGTLQNESIPTTLVSTASVNNITKNIKWVEEPIDEELLKAVLDIFNLSIIKLGLVEMRSGNREYKSLTS